MLSGQVKQTKNVVPGHCTTTADGVEITGDNCDNGKTCAVKDNCDAETTTQSDIDNGIVNIEVAFAPLKPAEFVILKIQQIARRADS